MENNVIDKQILSTQETNISNTTQSQIAQLPKEQTQQAQLPKIEIGTLQAVFGIAAVLIALGIAWGTLRTLVVGVKETLDKDIKPDLKNVRERLPKVEHMVETLWQDKYAPSHSPRQLNDKGNEILDKSGIKEIIDGKKEKLFEIVKSKDVKTAYDAERIILEVMMELPKHCPDIVDNLKNGAFRMGVSIDAVLFVGSIYLRNQIFNDLGFKLDDLDKPRDMAR